MKMTQQHELAAGGVEILTVLSRLIIGRRRLNVCW